SPGAERLAPGECDLLRYRDWDECPTVRAFDADVAVRTEETMMYDHRPSRFDVTTIAQMLPYSFVGGTATAAAKIEGATGAGRRTASVWDRFSAEPGRIQDGSMTAVTTDHYHRYREDVALMGELGVDAYRFSLSWTRLQPEGRGPLD